MPRQPKPYFRKVQKRWVCSIDGQRVNLGEDREAAFRKFHEPMLDRENLASQIHTAYGLSQIYPDWCNKHRTKGTCKNHGVTKWIDDQTWIHFRAMESDSVTSV